MRVPFKYVFKRNNEGELRAKKFVTIGDIILTPEIGFCKGVVHSKYNLASMKCKDLEIEEEELMVTVKGVYESYHFWKN